MSSGSYILGSNVRSVEDEVARYCGVKCAVGVASGTDALVLALSALGIGREDEVITTPFTFFATAEAITQVGAKPVFVDIEEESFNIDPTKIEEKITEKTKAIIPVHLYGQSASMEPIMEIAGRHNLHVIEDAAQAFGAEHNFSQSTKKVGSIGELGCLSFYPTKNLGGCGDGGMILTEDEEIAERLRILRVHGARALYLHSLVGYNSRLDELQAAVLRVKLKHVDSWIEMRREKAFLYDDLLSSLKGLVSVPYQVPYARHTFCVYTIRAAQRDKLRDYLTRKEIGTRVYYPLSLHLQKVYAHLGCKRGDFPVSEKASGEVISLPMYPELKEEQIELVAREIKNFFSLA
ncbi:dTDP-3-amino-3,4,6-trideoxy-alpha-D-glucose transaminase [subsurface metagenome]